MRADLANRQDLAQHFRAGMAGDAVMASCAVTARKFLTFLDLAESLRFSPDEERTLLDVTARDLVRLRDDPTVASSLGAKLVRRLDYALPVLRRMLASAAN